MARLVVKAIEDMTVEEMVAVLREIDMTPEEIEAQRIDFAYGNVRLSNPNVTREDVMEAARRLRENK